MSRVESYHFTACAKQAVKDYYPRNRPTTLIDGLWCPNPEFIAAQKQLQAALIRCHFNDMDEPTRQRAINTLVYLGEIPALAPT